MADVFISYKREDADRVEILAQALKAQGLSVWWDAHLKVGEAFDAQIRQELDAAKHVIVCWSRLSVESDFVLAEAQEAHDQKKLIPVTLDDVRIPVPFNVIQTIKFQGWSAEVEAKPFRDLLRTLRGQGNRAQGPSETASAEPPAYVGGTRMNRLMFLLTISATYFVFYLAYALSERIRFHGDESLLFSVALALGSIFSIWGTIAALVARLHDLGRTGHWAWLLVPGAFFASFAWQTFRLPSAPVWAVYVIHAAFWLPFVVLAGNWRSNRFGPPPEASSPLKVSLALFALAAGSVFAVLFMRTGPSEAALRQSQYPVWRLVDDAANYEEARGKLRGPGGGAFVAYGAPAIGNRLTVWPNGNAFEHGREELLFSTNFPSAWEIFSRDPISVPSDSGRIDSATGEDGTLFARPVYAGPDLDEATYECAMSATRFQVTRSFDLIGNDVFSPRNGPTDTAIEVFAVRGQDWAVGDPTTRLPLDSDGSGDVWSPIASGSEAFLCMRHVRAAVSPAGLTQDGFVCIDELDLRTMQRRRLDVLGPLISSDRVYADGPLAGQPFQLRLAGYADNWNLQPVEAIQSTGTCRKVSR